MDRKTENMIRTNFKDALADFSFVRIYDVMHYLAWTWHGKRESPSYKEMQELVEELFESTIEDFKGQMISSSSGGFEITIYTTGKVGIRFVLNHSLSPQ